jgi:hypothetical protein
LVRENREVFQSNNLNQDIMSNLLKSLFGKKEETTKETLRDILDIRRIFQKWENHRLIYWRRKDKLLLIEESLAAVELSKGREFFMDFLTKAALWQNSHILDEAYEAHRLKIETEAVRKAQARFAMLTKADLQRIRQQAREDMKPIPPEQLDCIKEFDILIVRASAPSAEQATKENGQLLAVGHFDGQKVEMAMYDDIKHTIFSHD